MNQGLKKGLIWGLVLTAVGVGGYYLYKSLSGKGGSKEDEDKFDGDENPFGENVAGDGGGGASTPPKKKTDVYRWLSKGKRDSANQNEIEKLQYIFNRMRLAAFTAKANKAKYDKLSSSMKKWVDALTKQPKLVVDGVFGSKTEAMCYTAMGNKGTQLCKARQRRMYLNEQLGLYNPYAKWGTVCGKY